MPAADPPPGGAEPQHAADPPAVLVTLPNLITLARLCAVPAAVWLILQHRLDTAFLVFVGAGISDAVDGWLARVRNARSALGGRVPGLAPAATASAAPAAGAPASNWVDAVATYRSMAEWLDLVRRLKGAGQVASVDILAIAVDAARLRLGLRGPAESVIGDLAGLGVQMVPAAGASPGSSWRVGLAGGG